jgi:hypothetical protein
MDLVRQGDLMLVRLPQLPQGAKRRKEAVLELKGETGHSHRLLGAQLYEGPQGQPLAVVAPDAEAVLEHPEHPLVEIPEGVWEVRRPQIFDFPVEEDFPLIRFRREEETSRTLSRSIPYVD